MLGFHKAIGKKFVWMTNSEQFKEDKMIIYYTNMINQKDAIMLILGIFK